MKNLYASLLIFASLNIKAQDHETLYWTRYAPTFEFKKWDVRASIEDRIAFKAGERKNLLANIAFLYKPAKSFIIGVGFAHFTTYDNQKNGLPVPELRPFQEVGIRHESFKLGIDHRFRAEERFKQDTLEMRRLKSYNYTFRMRYRLELTYSLVKKRKEQGHFGFQIKDEIFVSAGHIAESFDQNRLYGGFVYQVSKPIGLEFGYMWVNKNEIDDPDTNSDVVRITIRHSIDFK